MAKFNHETSYFYKFSDEKFDIEFDFTDSFATGETLSSCDVTAVNSLGEDVSSSMITNKTVSSPDCYFTVQDGTAGETYQIKVQGTSSTGKVYTSYITCEVFDSVTLNANLGDSTANSYVTVAEANEYIRNVRGHSSLWDTLSMEGKKRVLIEAARIIDSLNFIDKKYYDSQALEFPRNTHTTVTGNAATPFSKNSFTNSGLYSTTYNEKPDNYYKYGTCHITAGTPLGDIRLIQSSDSSNGKITMFTDFTATPNANTKFIVFEPLYKSIKNAQCEQAIQLVESKGGGTLYNYKMLGAESVRIGDVRVDFDSSESSNAVVAPKSRELLSGWTRKRVKYLRA